MLRRLYINEMWVCHNTHPLSFCRVILNEVKNLKSAS